MDAGMPYFMTNPDWYTVIDISEDFPEDGRGYHLTDSAPEEAVKSYEEFYSLVESEGFPLNNDKQGKWWNESSVTGKFDYQLDRHCSKTGSKLPRSRLGLITSYIGTASQNTAWPKKQVRLRPVGDTSTRQEPPLGGSFAICMIKRNADISFNSRQ